VTVIIPTFNWSTVLPFSIGSVLDQTFDDFELLVIGDGCTDNSATVVRACGVGDSRVRWHNLATNGRSQAGPNNEGLKLARGRIVAYLGHDDLWLPRHLELLVHALEDAAFARTRTMQVNPEAAPFLRPGESWTYRSGEWIPPTCVAHRRDVGREVGGWRFPTETGELDPESDLWRRIAERHGPPELVPRVTAIKLPAAYRRDSYRFRPCHEQAGWLARIRRADDAEAEITALAGPVPADDALEPGVPLALAPVPGRSAAERQRVARQYKGLPTG
jgi:glycosyltransferase involved in cell wall biosynthesis